MSNGQEEKQTAATGSQQSEAWTVLRLLEWTTEFFKKKGSESARLDAEILLAHARGCSRIELYTAFAEVPGDEERVAFREMVRRRGEGTPVAQLVGYREFYSLQFRVDENVLIPRPETEHLVIEAIDCAKELDGGDRSVPLQMIDIGTGSGAIAISVAKNLPSVQVTAVDLSPGALKIAKWNIDQHEVAEQVTLVEGDLFSAIESGKTFDLVCSNPPYVSEAEFAELAPTVRDFEPKMALVSGPTGTETIERLVADAPQYMNAGGRLIIELSPMIADACAEIVQRSSEFTDLRFIKDLQGHRRILSTKRV